MDLLEIMRRRRSIRNYSGEEIPEESLTKVLQAGLLSASGKAKRPWEFIQGRLRNADEKTTEEFVRERLGFPENYKLEAILTLGMPDAEAPAHQLDELPMEKIKWERYQK